MPNVLISFIGRDDVREEGALNRTGPLFHLINSRRYSEIHLFVDTHTKVAAETLRSEYGKKFQVRTKLIRGEGDPKPQSPPRKPEEMTIKLYEFSECQDYENGKGRLLRQLELLPDELGSKEMHIHLNAWNSATVSAITVLVVSGLFQAELVQVQVPVGGLDADAVISTIAMPEQQHAVELGVYPRLREPAEKAVAAELVSLYGADREFCRVVDGAFQYCCSSDGHMLLEGPPGSGKAKLAHFIYEVSSKGRGVPFVEVDCSLPEGTLGDILFREGRNAFDRGAGGVLFLRKLDRLSSEMQAALVARMKKLKASPVRIIGASAEDVSRLISERELRSDLLEFMSGRFTLPALNARSDVNQLAEYLLAGWNLVHGRSLSFSAAVKARLRAYDWPGNVSELRGVVFSSAEQCQGNVINLRDISIGEGASQSYIAGVEGLPEPAHGFSLPLYLKDVQAQIVQKALDITGGNQTKAGALLGMERGPMGRCVREHNLRAARKPSRRL